MISLIEVASAYEVALERAKSDDLEGLSVLSKSMENALGDRREVLNKLEERASEVDTFNAWNRYEIADNSYALAEELNILISEFIDGDADKEEIEYQLSDGIDRAWSETRNGLERSQW
jgi:hypothetical protein